ncbi:hypothetical protein KBB85_03330 [Patescibacteria group bacterium]|nr:hypothetical protein [Patescibacteria group bacterium]
MSEQPERVESLSEVERTDRFIKRHEIAFRSLVRIAYQEASRERGDDVSTESTVSLHEDLRYRIKPTFRTGKQQTVCILEVKDETGEKIEVVCKNDGRHMLEQQLAHPILQKLLPKIFLEEEEIVVIERLNGLELKPYQAFLREDPKHLDQLVDDAMEILEELATSPFKLHDADFMGGQNVMYDVAQKKFRLFDIHSLSDSDPKMSGNERIIRFLNDQFQSAEETSEETAYFTGLFLEKYLAQHPESSCEFKGWVARELEDGTPEYEQRLSEIYAESPRNRSTAWRGAISISEKGIIGLRKDIRDACIQGHPEMVSHLLTDPRYRKTQNQL